MNEIAAEVEEIDKPKSESEIDPPEEAASTITGSVIAAVSEITEQIGRRRWLICALLFFATTINYVDRQVLGILTTDEGFKATIGWNPVEYGWINSAFQAAYAVGLLVVGGFMDRFGTRKGFSVAMVVWSVASMAHSLARSALGFGVARVALGMGESGNFPAAIKTVAEWFPKKERALATGIFNSGSNVGAILAPIAVPIIAINYGWEWAFILTGLFGFIWLAFWIAIYRKPEDDPKLSRGELAHILSDKEEPMKRVVWRRLIPHRQTWSFSIGKFLTDPIWWVWLFWVPPILNEKFKVNISGIALPLIVIYVIADIGSIGGGYLSSALIKSGRSVNQSRKLAMLICAICVVPVLFVPFTDSLWTAVLLISLAAAAHQGWSANIFTTASDMFPRQAVGSVVGFGGMVGSVGGVILQATVGYVKDYTGSYLPVFFIAASAYLIALAIMHVLTPRLEPAVIDTE